MKAFSPNQSFPLGQAARSFFFIIINIVIMFAPTWPYARAPLLPWMGITRLIFCVERPLMLVVEEDWDVGGKT